MKEWCGRSRNVRCGRRWAGLGGEHPRQWTFRAMREGGGRGWAADGGGGGVSAIGVGRRRWRVREVGDRSEPSTVAGGGDRRSGGWLVLGRTGDRGSGSGADGGGWRRSATSGKRQRWWAEAVGDRGSGSSWATRGIGDRGRAPRVGGAGGRGWPAGVVVGRQRASTRAPRARWCRRAGVRGCGSRGGRCRRGRRGRGGRTSLGRGRRR